jgi:hypothetical protein
LPVGFLSRLGRIKASFASALAAPRSPHDFHCKIILALAAPKSPLWNFYEVFIILKVTKTSRVFSLRD